MAFNKAQFNYYVTLVRKGYLTIDQIPEFIRHDVQARVNELPPIEFDPVTQTPALGEPENPDGPTTILV